MRGYNIKPPGLDLNKTYTENALVGCRNCSTTWREEMTFTEGMARINGPMYCYQRCDQCLTDDEKSYLDLIAGKDRHETTR